MLEIIVLLLITIASCKETRAFITDLHKKGFTGKAIAASKIAPIYWIVKKEKDSVVMKKASRDWLDHPGDWWCCRYGDWSSLLPTPGGFPTGDVVTSEARAPVQHSPWS